MVFYASKSYKSQGLKTFLSLKRVATALRARSARKDDTAVVKAKAL